MNRSYGETFRRGVRGFVGIAMAHPKDDLIDCKDSPYSIKRGVCWARQKEGRRMCRRCPERGGQLFLFGSPRQVEKSRDA